MSLIDQLVEARIGAAVADGDFEGLPGEGQPLSLEDTTMVPEELRVAYRLLKNAGAIPPELQRRLDINTVQSALRNTDDDSERRRLYVKLSLLKSALNHPPTA